MAEKYIDLRDAIVEDLHLTESEASGADAAMRWLHMHPDRVPGRAITDGEMDHKCATYGSAYETGFKQAGGRIVPDPEVTNAEPTNAELLVEDLAGIYGANLTWTAKIAISEALAERGWVKAPGGD